MILRDGSLEDAIDAARSGRNVSIKCPAHDDDSPSLSVGPGRDQPVVLTCFAGCDTHSILEAGGLGWDAISNERDPNFQADIWTPAKSEGGYTDSSMIWDYCDAEGTLQYQVVRVRMPDGKKRIFQRRPTPDGGWKWNLDGVERTILHLPKVLEVIRNGGTVHIAEGEKCVDALERAVPVTDAVTCNSGGAGRWTEAMSDWLFGAKVVIYADSDDPGRQHARDIKDQLDKRLCQSKIVEPRQGTTPSGKQINDIEDHLAAGFTGRDLIVTTPESMAEKARTGVDVIELVKRPKVVEEWAVEGTLAKGERLTLIGLEGHGKSLVLRQVAACTAAGLHPFTLRRTEPKRVLYIDAENHPNQTLESWSTLVTRCRENGAEIQRGQLIVLEEWDSEHDLAGEAGRAWLRERVHAYRPDLLILGPLTNLAYADLSSYEVVDRLRRTINGVRDICNPAIIMEHHAPLRMTGDKKREIRPYGSGLFLKWPDFGYGLVPTETQGLYEWSSHRGDRVRGRSWPEALRWGDPRSLEFPWMEAEPPDSSPTA